MFPSLKNVNPKPRRARLGLETLSAREVPAVVASWFPTTGELVVTGTDFGDTIFVQEMAGQVSVPGVPIRVRTGAWPAPEVDALSATVVTRITIDGRGGNDTLTFATVLVGDPNKGALNRPIPARIWGGVGNDVLTGDAGDDALDGGSGDDVLNGAGGSDELFGRVGRDELHGGDGDDTLHYALDATWGAGARSPSGQPIAGLGRSYDQFDGGADEDRLDLTGGWDALLLDDRTAADPQRLTRVEVVDARTGNDVVDLAGAYSFDYRDAGVPRIRVNGGNGDDVLVGNVVTPGDLFGDAGNDRLIAGIGQDRLDGGSGTDRADAAAGQAGLTSCESVNLRVPTDQPQTDDWSCGPNSVSRLLRAYNISASYAAVRDFTDSDGNLVSWAHLGTPSSALIDTLRHWKPDARREDESNANRVIELLRQGKPVIALVSMGRDRHHIDLIFDELYIGSTGRLHYVVINGYDAATDSFTFTNTNGEVGTWTRAQFLGHWNWHDDFTGAFGEVAQAGVSLLGLRERTLFF
jgi:Ca2+-binding RTX toxin-like protein